jgi:hypothetical protein
VNFTLAHLVAHGSDLLGCEGLLGLEAVLAGLEQGETGAESEIRIIAFFRRAGLVVVLEPRRGCGGRHGEALRKARQKDLAHACREAPATLR